MGSVDSGGDDAWASEGQGRRVEYGDSAVVDHKQGGSGAVGGVVSERDVGDIGRVQASCGGRDESGGGGDRSELHSECGVFDDASEK